MVLVNYGYFLFGIFLFLAWRIFHLIPYFKRTPYPTPGSSSAIFFTIGAGYIILIVNIFQNIDLSYGFDCLTLLPTIIMAIACFNFFSESFIAPTKNYLVALGLGIGIGLSAIFLLNFIFQMSNLAAISSYLIIIPVIGGLLLGLIIGAFIHGYFLQNRYPRWNQPLWQIHKFWDVLNHSSFLVFLATLTIIEALLQWYSTSLILILTSY
jgi:hypothetical protein